MERMLDTIGADAGSIPASAEKVAVYITGGGGIAWSSEQIARLRDRHATVVLIDQTNRGDPHLLLPYVVIDSERGAATIPDAAGIAHTRARHRLRTGIYIQMSNFDTAWQAIADVRTWVDFWIADWNLNEREATSLLGRSNIVAVQWASPTSNPHTPVPGSDRTLSEANIDLSVTLDSWPVSRPAPKPKPKPRPSPRPHRKVIGATAAAGLVTAIEGILHAFGLVHLTPAEASAITSFAAAVGGWTVPAVK